MNARSRSGHGGGTSKVRYSLADLITKSNLTIMIISLVLEVVSVKLLLYLRCGFCLNIVTFT